MELPVYAGFWLRVLAFILDSLILAIPNAVITRVTGGGSADALMSLAVTWLYFALMESSLWQATLGKKALGLKVTDMNGGRIEFGRATGRYFGKILSGMALLVGYIMVAFTEKKQGLHDILASTLVVREGAATPQSSTPPIQS